MKFTFGIITTGNSQDRINNFINSVKSNNIPLSNYEILVIGGNDIKGENLVHIPFNENIKSSWITKKKNLITSNAKFDNIVYLHDYFILLDNWYSGFVSFGDNWDLCMNKILNADNSRFRDWSLFPHFIPSNFPVDVLSKREFMIPYDYDKLTKYQYISGSYWVAKKNIMIAFPLDENLCWGQGEDVKWSNIVLTKEYKYSMNANSSVKINKNLKHNAEFIEMLPETVSKLKKFF